jgi:hypothetical protein
VERQSRQIVSYVQHWKIERNWQATVLCPWLVGSIDRALSCCCVFLSMYMMFSGAASFDQNLCFWGSKLLPRCLTYAMFQSTSCPAAKMAPDLTASPRGPFCDLCTNYSAGSSVTVLSAWDNMAFHFRIRETIEVGQSVTCELEVPSGDANLFIKFGSVPDGTYTDCDCASVLLGTFDEDCTTVSTATNRTAYVTFQTAQPSYNVTLFCFINDINCVQENQPCMQTEECCGTMVCDGNETISNRCVPCDRPKPCETAKCASSNKPCKQSRSPCCRRFACDDSINRCERKRL